MEEIDLSELFMFFKKRLIYIILIIAVVCVGGVLYSLFLQTPMYSSYTTVVLGSNESNSYSASITQTDVILNKDLVNTYAEIAKSRKVLERVIKELELDIKYDELVKLISVTAVNDTEIIKITVKDDDPIKAKNIANVTANYFSKQVINLYNLDNVNILDEAIENDTPYNINIVKQLIIYFMIGFVLSFGILFVIYYFDRTIKSIEQIEKRVKLPILGSVEIYEHLR